MTYSIPPLPPPPLVSSDASKSLASGSFALLASKDKKQLERFSIAINVLLLSLP
jgi:hypothetical protein